MSVKRVNTPDYLYTTTLPVSSPPFTISLWANLSNESTYNQVLAAIDRPDVAGYQILGALEASGAVEGSPFRVYTYNGSDYGVAETTTGFHRFFWYHFAGVFTSSSLRAAFIDGGSKGTNTDVLSATPLELILCRRRRNDPIGSMHSGPSYIAEVAIWNTNLSDSEIDQLSSMVNPQNISSENLIAYWPLYDNPNDVIGTNHLTEVALVPPLLYSTTEHPNIGPLWIAPTITDQSTDTDAYYGQIVSFFVTTTGNPDPTYQWYLNGDAIDGETNSVIEITASEDTAGTYSCIVTNVAGSDTSDDIELQVYPYISDQSDDTTIEVGEDVTLMVTAGGYPSVSYQWYKNKILLDGEISPSISLTSAEKTDQGTYYCIVTNDIGEATSDDIELTVNSHEAGSRLPENLISEKNKRRSSSGWVLLLEFLWNSGEYYRVAQWKESVTFEEHEFTPMNIQFDSFEQKADGSLPSTTLRVSNITFPIEYQLQDPDRIVGSSCRLIWVNLDYLEEVYSEMEVTFTILDGSYDWQYIDLDLGMPNLLGKAFPEGRFIPEGCDNVFKDFDCGYTGIDIVDVDISEAGNVIVEVASHTFTTGDRITLDDVDGITPSLDGNYTGTVVDDTHISLDNTETSAYSGSYTGDSGKISFTYCRKTFSQCRTRQNSNRVLTFIGLRSGTIKLV